MVRIGPKMSAVIHYVANHPGCSMLAAAEYVAPRGSLKFGYRTVHRALKSGAIYRVRKSKGYGYHLFTKDVRHAPIPVLQHAAE